MPITMYNKQKKIFFIRKGQYTRSYCPLVSYKTQTFDYLLSQTIAKKKKIFYLYKLLNNKFKLYQSKVLFILINRTKKLFSKHPKIIRKFKYI